ncbi:hypothetical protein MPTK1_4g02880 [Marchantia polymorpha subsp. ruderalis]|uniref:F-box domain-containing protein n=2 Tax=Marchantia polymorpha TaxID=3197 RepID=A0AAF6B5N8_MARPO|nr:hypothetical protein MARPO_0080s0011 [Marchantia polymorpha]BBN07322.1 hypothetical protein Mp_4g02880 [Marchantia polymorpha subsp. ruderalis]|eukprot:PTQ34382.1 hypothetical protein MARPO_0080s0011 [Marchantia polymorpha]
MGDDGAPGLDQLPHHLLQRILQLGDFEAADLASLEASCYTFRAATGLGPIRFKSMTENTALQACQSDSLFKRLPHSLQSQLAIRCNGNWKMVLRYLKAFQQAVTGVTTYDGKVQVVAGKYLTLFIDSRGSLYGCGSNKFGVLGQELSVSECRIPVCIQVPVPVLQVSASSHHVALVSRNGEVYTYGDNSSNCLGHGEIGGQLFQPRLVETLKNIPCKQVSTGLMFTAALTREGEVYTWGSSSNGQLGHGDMVDQSRPVRIEALVDAGHVIQVATGPSFTFALLDCGKLYSVGGGNNYCLGHGDFSNDAHPREVLFFDEQKVFVSYVAAGDEHAVAIDSSGYVYTWGKGYCGPLGHGNEEDQVIPKLVEKLRDVRAVQVSARRRKTFVVTDTSELYGFGWMGLGSLGLENRGTSEKILEPELVPGLRVAQVSTGNYHTVATSPEGYLKGIGDSGTSQLNFSEKFLFNTHLL